MAFMLRDKMPEIPRDVLPQAPIAPEAQPSAFSKRSLRQLGLFFGGAVFFTYAQVITRRSLIRRYKSIAPKFYQPSNRPNADVNGTVEAFEALTIATVNVLSASMMLAGGALWAFDISSLGDLRRKIRGGLGIDDSEGRENAAEKEMEEWLATVLARKDEKERRRKNNQEEER